MVHSVIRLWENIYTAAHEGHYQPGNYFPAGDVAVVEPLILKHISDEVSSDISTFSKVTGKYHDTQVHTAGLGLFIKKMLVQIKLKEIIKT